MARTEWGEAEKENTERERNECISKKGRNIDVCTCISTDILNNHDESCPKSKSHHVTLIRNARQKYDYASRVRTKVIKCMRTGDDAAMCAREEISHDTIPGFCIVISSAILNWS